MIIQLLIQRHKTYEDIRFFDAIFLLQIYSEFLIIKFPAEFLYTQIQILAVNKRVVVLVMPHLSLVCTIGYRTARSVRFFHTCRTFLQSLEGESVNIATCAYGYPLADLRTDTSSCTEG